MNSTALSGGVVGCDCAVDHGSVGVPRVDSASHPRRALCDCAIPDSWAAMITEDPPAQPAICRTIGDRQTFEDRISSFAMFKVETSGGILAVNYGGSDYCRFVGVDAADGDWFAEKIDVTVAGAGISSGCDDYCVAVVAVVYGCLDVGVLGGDVACGC